MGRGSGRGQGSGRGIRCRIATDQVQESKDAELTEQERLIKQKGKLEQRLDIINKQLEKQ